MITDVRNEFNAAFTGQKYLAYLNELDAMHPGQIDFRVAETPVFCDKAFTRQMISACEHIVDVITAPGFVENNRRAVPADVFVAGEIGNPDCIAFDFGVCENSNGELEPQLIEMQGFPTLFAYQPWQISVIQQHFSIPPQFSAYLSGLNKRTYLQLLKDIILKDYDPDQVILLELFPHQQKTRIDFYCTQDYVGIQPVCLTELIRKGRKLYYLKDGIETEIKRIYNRVIFDDLQQQTPEVQEKGKLLLEELDVEWVPHPNWFYLISKYTLPFIQHPNVPETTFLSDLKELPANLDQYVLKPLFSFAGQGVVIDVTPDDIEHIKDPENWILQKKVKYADIIATPDGPAKCEIRIFYFWKTGELRPIATCNLARLSKGKMIGVRYNKDKTWVGGTVAFFEEDLPVVQ